ncbi:MAG: hypothetical protein P8184_21955 [Calditrichia bacterium]
MNEKRFSRFIIALCFMAVSGTSLFAQTDSLLRKGSWALQFQVHNFISFSDFQGMNLSAKWQLKQNSALRFGVTLSGDNRDRDLVNTSPTTETRTEYDNSSLGIGLNAQYIWYIPSLKKIRFFYGAGPLISYQSQSEKRISRLFMQDSLLDADKRDMDTDSWQAGISCVLGAEWFVHRSISLLAEYGTRAYYVCKEQDLPGIAERAD